ncbi:C2 domain-containing protein 3 [Asbolus verrucosus]|uniref:C2 domain-containing protein 3 n=1 Tax=Asbolus verrucosus TaxID=1661398 RepID=A0A482W2N7_ASBVE|nr:C2 domain-containing protein 3 [Asbolus verrucosus]
MSCFNCYSTRKSDGDLVDKILERGHKLRSAMVQSILHNDPFNTEIIYSQDRCVRLDELPEETNNKIRAFLQGDAMSREDEIATLETLRSMSAVDLCRATDKTYRSDEPCDCLTCTEYNEKDLVCDLKRNNNNEITQKIQERYRNKTMNYLKFVDSLKVTVSSVTLNEAGDKKVLDSLIKDKSAGVGQTFFLEYQIPEVLSKNHQQNKSKVDSGLDFNNTVRLCSRRSHQQAIAFKQTSVHDIPNLSKVKLDDLAIKFRLCFRNFKQKHPISLGFARFNFNSFEVMKNFTCSQELAFKLNESTPLVVGALRLSVQLGCGRLYFGKEFIGGDAITNNKENSIALGSDDLSSSDSDIVEKIIESYSTNVIQKPKLVSAKPKPKQDLVFRNSEPVFHKPKPFYRRPEPVFRKPEPVPQKSKPASQKAEPVREILPKSILFGFIYISEAQFSREVLNSYLACQMLDQDNISCSKLVAFGSNPIYNFCQQIPLVYEDELLLKFRENFMVVEFFEKDQNRDFLIGVAKLNLHQFYLAYRNHVIVKYLSENKAPVIGTDGWEPIINPNDEELVGQVQILLALGTKEQIDNLEAERGFKKNIVKAKSPVKDSVQFKTVEVGVQSNMEANKQSRDIETFLSQMVAQKTRNVHVENSTNTEPVNTNSDLKSTSDLLDSLQRALSWDNLKGENTTFKAHVVINSALHLPSRRKCKSRRSKGRNGKHEDILPSTYVTFESDKSDLQMTPIVPKTTNPKWDYRCDVALPIEYLTNNQKFLVFKIWRKSTNTTMMPNMQTDIVIGFATVDLTVLSAGLPSVQGWFNINDLSNKCNGQINIHVTPLENISKYQLGKETLCCNNDNCEQPQSNDISDESSELLGRALKRKFTELDEITQRLRLRLSKVTNDESDTSNDEIADEFERDINTLCVEDDFDMIDFEKEAHSFNLNHVKEVGLLKTDQHLIEGKQKIDVLLEKLSLISGENSSRYVSGCSDSRIDAEAILNELDFNSRPNIHTTDSFSKDMVQKFGSSLTSETCSVFSDGRAAPEGERLTDAKPSD